MAGQKFLCWTVSGESENVASLARLLQKDMPRLARWLCASLAAIHPMSWILALPAVAPSHCRRLAFEQYRAWKIELSGSPPFKVQFVRVGHQQEKRHMLDWDDGDGLSIEVGSPLCARLCLDLPTICPILLAKFPLLPHCALVQYKSAGQHDLPGEMFQKKGLWVVSMIKDESGCPADIASITGCAPRVADILSLVPLSVLCRACLSHRRGQLPRSRIFFP